MAPVNQIAEARDYRGVNLATAKRDKQARSRDNTCLDNRLEKSKGATKISGRGKTEPVTVMAKLLDAGSLRW
jgi:hypothetical protein